MTDLLLHIGHMKTGTTALQDVFRNGTEALARAGIIYPPVGDAGREVDLDARVPTGNGRVLIADPARTANRLRRAVADPSRSALFSSEMMFDQVHETGDVEALVRASREIGFDRIRILLFTRAPAPLAVSIWQQRVKGWQGEIRSLDDFLGEAFDWPERVLRVIRILARVPDIELEFRNYDAHRADLLAAVEAWLGLAPGSLPRTQGHSTNRSLTRAEAALQLAMNRVLGPRSGQIFAFRLVNRLPDIPPDPPRPTPAAVARMLERQRAALDALDERLPAGEALTRKVPQTPGASELPSPLMLDEAQLTIIAEGIAAYLAAKPEPPAPAWRRAARALRRRLCNRFWPGRRLSQLSRRCVS